jgi:phosphatidylglycerophosphatase A
VVGYVIAMTWLPLTWQSFLAAFVVFRFFDILKPGPIRRIDQRVKGGLGTVLDDVAAGLVSSVILQVLLRETHWLGGSSYAF